MYAARATTRTLQLQRGAFVSRHSALLRQSQSRGNAAAAVVNNGLKSSSSSSSSLKSSNNNGVDEAPPDFVRLGIQRMLEQAQQHNDNDSSYYKQNDSLSTEIENSKALQALELVQVRNVPHTYMHCSNLYTCIVLHERVNTIIVHRGRRIGLTSFLLLLLFHYYSLLFVMNYRTNWKKRASA